MKSFVEIATSVRTVMDRYPDVPKYRREELDSMLTEYERKEYTAETMIRFHARLKHMLTEHYIIPRRHPHFPPEMAKTILNIAKMYANV